MKPQNLFTSAAALLPLSVVAHTGVDGGQHHALLGELAHAFDHLFTGIELSDAVLIGAGLCVAVVAAVVLSRKS